MAQVVHDTPQEFWRPPSVVDTVTEAVLPSPSAQDMAEACESCDSEFMIGARFCHTCGLRRPALSAVRASSGADAAALAGLWTRSMTWLGAAAGSVATACRKIPIPEWLHYLHFHEIKRWVGLPTAALIAFMVGLGCIAGALGVSLFYKASNLAEFQAIQMWRIEWLLAATASFVAGILLKNPSDSE
jgi:hypothetical protein